VGVAGGRYPPQTIPLDGSKSGSAPVVFQPVSGASVQIQATGVAWGNALEITAHHVTVKNISVGDRWAVDGGADDVEMDNVSAPRLFIGSASNVSVHGGNFGPFLDSAGAGGSHIWPDSASSPDPTNILIDGISMHDYSIPAGSGYHLDCLTIGGGTNVVVQRSKFWNCNGFDAWTKPFPKSYGTNGLTFVNNVFGPNLGGTPQVFSLACADAGSTLSNITVEYNSFGGEASLGTTPFPCTGVSNVVFDANILPQINPANCGDIGFTTRHNVVQANACGSSDVVAPTGYVSSTDYHLVSGAAAINHGDPSIVPSTDFAGTTRLNPTDAGAYQH